MKETLKVNYVIGFFFEPVIAIHYIPVEEIRYDSESHQVKNRVSLRKQKNIYNKSFGRKSKVNFV